MARSLANKLNNYDLEYFPIVLRDGFIERIKKLNKFLMAKELDKKDLRIRIYPFSREEL